MAKIPKHVSGSHDQAVRKLASQLKKEDWQVRADLPNRKQPDPIGKDGRIPDIQATKRGRTKLIEVETPSTVNSHKQQATTFRRSAAQKKNTNFNLVIADA